jgi:hypothetical protein
LLLVVAPVPIPLLSGAYAAQNTIANYQRCVNLYPESNPQETKSPVPVTHYLAPGLAELLTFPDAAQVRCVYQATAGVGYAVCGATVYFIPPPSSVGVWTYSALGTLTTTASQVKMMDNGQNLLIADGSDTGWQVNLATNVMTQVTAAANSGTNGFAYYGANYVDYSDTFLFGNIPKTARWFASASGTLAFDPLSFATKSGSADPLQAVIAIKRYVLLIGTLATEWWYNAGGANFPYALLPGPYVEHGCEAQYSVLKTNESVLWLSKSRQGRGLFLRVNDFTAIKKSTYALEAEWLTYPTLVDAIAFTFQLAGHTFVGLRFPSAGKTWVYDMDSDQWHERTTLDANGRAQQWRVNCTAQLYGMVVGGDYGNGKLYEISAKYTDDNGTPIQRIRGFPHIMSNLVRIRHNFVTADFAVGAAVDRPFPLPLQFDNTPDSALDWYNEQTLDQMYADPAPPIAGELANPEVYLRYSTSRGKSWSTLLKAELGLPGDYHKIIQWRRLSMARDMIFEFSWITPQITALNGAYIGPLPSIS